MLSLLTTPADHRQKKWIVLALLGLCGVLASSHAVVVGHPWFPVDDAYIVLHSAQVLHAGEDRNYPGTPAAAGATSLPHLVLIAAFLFILPPAWAMFAASWLGIALYALALASLAFAHRASSAQAVLLVAAGLTAGLTPHQLLNGMETGLAMAALTWALALAVRGTESQWTRRAILYGLLPFLRPELVVVSALLLAKEFLERRRRTGSSAAAAAVAVVALGAAVPWLAWYLLSVGTPFPSTIQAKGFFFAEGCLPVGVKRDWVLASLIRIAGTVGFVAFGAAFLWWSLVGRAGLVFSGALALAYYTKFPGALGHYEQRYLYVLVPWLVLGLASAVSSPSRPWRRAGAVLLVLAAIQSISGAPAALELNSRNSSFTRVELEGVSRWCRENLPEDATLLIHDAGYISVATGFRLIDFVGLKTPSSIEYHQGLTQPSCGAGRGEAVHQIALRHRPGYLVMLQGWDEIYGVTAALRQRGWRLDSLRPAEEAPASTAPAYRVYQLAPPVGFAIFMGAPR